MFEEVVKGKVNVMVIMKVMFVKEVKVLVERGVQVIIFGSIDLGFLFSQEDVGEFVLLFDVVMIYVEGVVNWVCDS